MKLSSATRKELEALLNGCMLSADRRKVYGNQWVDAEISLLSYILGKTAADPLDYIEIPKAE